MAFKKTLVQRLFNLSRFSTQNVSKAPAGKSPPPARDRRRMHQAAVSPAAAGLRLFPPAGESVLERLRGMDIARNRINLDGLIMPMPAASEDDAPLATVARDEGLSVRDVQKVLRASQAEMIRGRLRREERDWIPYSEFVGFCKESCGENLEQGLAFAKTLDESGSVIVLGNAVCLRPHQVAKAIQSLVSPTLSSGPHDPDPRREELEALEEQKAEIDRRADALVRRELWAGLGYLVAQTAAFMRLTFWELSWDVMEPICFYVTSFYFMAGYAFFLRTSKEPSFEGFFQSRFAAKQKRLMEAEDFDLERYHQLRRAFHPHRSAALSFDGPKLIKFDDHNKND